MLDALIIVLREVLEASLLGSLLILLAREVGVGVGRLLPGMLLGLSGAIVYALNIGIISELWDYTGQELVNAAMQLLIFLATLVLFLLLAAGRKSGFAAALIMIIALALIREFSEIYLYLSSFWGDPDLWLPVLFGAAIGMLTGISLGVLLFFMLVWQLAGAQLLLWAQRILAIVVAGLLVQAVSLLLQVDYLPAMPALWDSSALVAEQSLSGQLLYAAVGYEATPTLWHVLCYVGALTLLLSLVRKVEPTK